MPQINIYTYLSQTTWTLILFVLYYINMKQVLLPSLLETIKIKNNSIQNTSETNTSTLINKYNNKYLNL